MVIRAPVEPVMLTWARERAGMHEATLALRFPRLREWEQGRVAPTLKQLEAFAAATFVPTGVLFLKSPPEERLPIPDFRTMGGGDVERPSPHLLETIYDCADRQAWYRSHARQNSEPALAFVGSASLGTPVSDAAESMAQVLRFGVSERASTSTWADALRLFITRADEAGVLVMVSGVVKNNTHRPLDPREFQGSRSPTSLRPSYS